MVEQVMGLDKKLEPSRAFEKRVETSSSHPLPKRAKES